MTTPTPSKSEFESQRLQPHELDGSEVWWRDRQVWLQERGYMLRPRYRPDWVPSWLDGSKRYYYCEDGRRTRKPYVLDATRIADGATVVLKQVSRNIHPYEVDITMLFASEPLLSDSKNHCVPVIDVLQVPDDDNIEILVMPILREFFDPRFLTIGEAVEFFRQAFEGLQFIHEHNVAHRDISELNVLMDAQPLFPDLYNFSSPFQRRDLNGWAKHYTRTGCPVKYYFIDFGLSRRFNPANGSPRSRPIWGGDRTVPEFHKSLQPCDPFPTDIYYMGNLIREVFLQQYHGLEFMQPLVDEMVQDEPEKRPTIQQVVTRFEPIQASLSTWRLRSRLAEHNEDWLLRTCRVIAHVLRTVGYLVTLRPALPKP